jgi:transposase-like protein
VEEARRDLAAWLTKWGKRYPKLCVWVEENIEETLSFYRLPRQHHKNLKSTNMLERIMEEIKRRTLIVRIFPTHRVVYGSSGHSQWRCTRTGSKRSAT